MVSALAVRGEQRSCIVCTSSSSNHERQRHQKREVTASSILKTPPPIPQRLAAAALAAAVLASSSTPFASPALAEEMAPSPIDAPALFFRNCAGCHAGGGNVVSPGNTLFEADLGRNGLLSSEKLFEIVYSGRGKMPGYGANCAPKGACTFAARLSDEEVRALGDFVLERAGQGWK